MEMNLLGNWNKQLVSINSGCAFPDHTRLRTWVFVGPPRWGGWVRADLGVSDISDYCGALPAVKTVIEKIIEVIEHVRFTAMFQCPIGL